MRKPCIAFVLTLNVCAFCGETDIGDSAVAETQAPDALFCPGPTPRYPICEMVVWERWSPEKEPIDWCIDEDVEGFLVS